MTSKEPKVLMEKDLNEKGTPEQPALVEIHTKLALKKFSPLDTLKGDTSKVVQSID